MSRITTNPSAKFSPSSGIDTLNTSLSYRSQPGKTARVHKTIRLQHIKNSIKNSFVVGELKHKIRRNNLSKQTANVLFRILLGTLKTTVKPNCIGYNQQPIRRQEIYQALKNGLLGQMVHEGTLTTEVALEAAMAFLSDLNLKAEDLKEVFKKCQPNQEIIDRYLNNKPATTNELDNYLPRVTLPPIDTLFDTYT